MAIELTPAAAERVRGFIAKYGGVGLRLGVKKTGCSGWAYTVDLATGAGDDDVVFDQDGVKVVVDRDSLDFLDGTTVDYVSTGMLNESFQFNNPNVADSCGCGESISFKNDHG